MNIDYKTIGARIQKERKSHGITQEVLAEKLEVSVGYISQIERGITKPNLEMLAAICTLLGCELAYIVSGTVISGGAYLCNDFEGKFGKLCEKEKRIVLALIDALCENR